MNPKKKQEKIQKSKYRIKVVIGVRKRKIWMLSFILMGSQFTSEEIILGQKRGNKNNVKKVWITDTSERRRKKSQNDFFLFFLFLFVQTNKKFLTWIQEEKKEKGENFLYHQMNGTEYKWKVWRRNQICKFKNVSFGYSRWYESKGFGIALHGFILLLPKCDYLFHTWNHHHFTSEL